MTLASGDLTNEMGFARKSIQNLKQYAPGKPIEEVRREFGIEGEVIKLCSNENPLGPSPIAVEAIRSYIQEIHLYPDDSCYYLKKKLAEIHDLLPDNIVVGNGSVEVIHLIAKAFLNPKEEVIISNPSFIMGKIESQIMDATLTEIPTVNGRVDVDGIMKSLGPNTKLIYIDNPNNPMGTMIEKKDIDRIVAILPENAILVLDEAYYEYLERVDLHSSDYYVNRNKNVIILRTFSKIYGLAGLRVGYGIARREIIEILNKVKMPFSVNKLGQIAAYYALDDSEHVVRSKRMVKEGKLYMYRELGRLGIKYFPSYTNFITLDFGINVEPINDALLKRGIIVRPLRSYGFDNYLRITIGTKKQNKKVIEALEGIVKSSI